MPQVKIFTTSTCPYCHAEKQYLDNQGIEYEEVLLDEQPEEIRTMTDTCGSMGTPCTHIIKDDGSEVTILGFDKQQLDTELGL